MANGLVKGSGIGDREWREDFALVNDSGTTVFGVSKSTGAITATGALGGTGNITVTNTAPALVLTDSTSSAKGLTIAVDANKAQLRESAGSAGSLVALDLANNRVGIGNNAPATTLEVTGNTRFDGAVQTYDTSATSSWIAITDSSALTRPAIAHFGVKLTGAAPLGTSAYMEGLFANAWLSADGSLADKQIRGIEGKATVSSAVTGTGAHGIGVYGKARLDGAATIPTLVGCYGEIEAAGTAVADAGYAFLATKNLSDTASMTASSAYGVAAATFTNGLNMSGATLTNEIVFSNGTKVTVSGDTIVFTNAAGAKSSTITMS